MNEPKKITYREVLKRLKNKKLEDYTKQDVLDRYVAYGSEKELQDPTIQRLLIKFDFIDSFIDTVDIITDKQVIKDLLNKQVQKNNLSIIVGEIINIDKQVYVTCQGTDIYCSVIKFKDALTNAVYDIKHHLLLEDNSLEEYKSKLEPYIKRGVAAIVTHKGGELLLRCYLEKYEDIDYTNISTYII